MRVLIRLLICLLIGATVSVVAVLAAYYTFSERHISVSDEAFTQLLLRASVAGALLATPIGLRGRRP